MNTITTILEETYNKTKPQLSDEQIKSYEELFIGKAFFFRTVTYHFIGTVKKVFLNKFLMFDDGVWVAESDRFMDTVKSGALREVEPIGEHYINIDTIVDMFPWKHEITKVQMPK